MPKKTAEKGAIKMESKFIFKSKEIECTMSLKMKQVKIRKKFFKGLQHIFLFIFGGNKVIEEILADKYIEIKGPFKTQTKHVLVSTSSELDGLSENMDN